MHLASTLPTQGVLLGHLKIGAKSAQVRTSTSGKEWRAPEKHDHFTITSLAKDAAGDYLPDTTVMAALSDYADADGQLRQIPVMPLSNNLEEILVTRYVWYKGEQMAGISDGTNLKTYFDRPKNAWLQTPKEQPWKPEYAELKDKDKPLFRLHAQLRVMLACAEARWGGYYQFSTYSTISIGKLYKTLSDISVPTQGMLRGLPLRLVLRPLKVKPNGKPTTVYVTHLELVGSDLQPFHRQAIAQATGAKPVATAPVTAGALKAPENPAVPVPAPPPAVTTPVTTETPAGDTVIDGLYKELPDGPAQVSQNTAVLRH